MFLKITISVSKYKLLVWFETDATKLPRQHHTHRVREYYLHPKTNKSRISKPSCRVWCARRVQLGAVLVGNLLQLGTTLQAIIIGGVQFGADVCSSWQCCKAGDSTAAEQSFAFFPPPNTKSWFFEQGSVFSLKEGSKTASSISHKEF